jgi:hypothetical protein
VELFLNERFQSFFFPGIQLSWPGSFLVWIAVISTFQGLILVAALGAYIVGTNSFRPHYFLIALYPALLVLILSLSIIRGVAVRNIVGRGSATITS